MSKLFETSPFMRAVVLPALFAVAVMAVLVGGVLAYSTSRSDVLAGRKQAHLLEAAIQQSVLSIQNEQEASTLWDDAVLQLQRSPLDLDWFDSNLGIWFNTYYQHDQVYVLDPAGQSVYSMQDGVRLPVERFGDVAAEVLPLARALRLAMRDGTDAREDGAGDTVGEHATVILEGRPAIISLKPILPESEDIVLSPGSEFLHVSIRFMDGDWAFRIGQDMDLAGLHFTEQRPEGASLPLQDSNGQTIGYFAWEPFRPGADVLRSMGPVLVITLILVTLLLWGLLVRVWRSRIELETSRAQAQHLAFHDSLTGLPNRALFEDRLAHALGRRDGGNVALLLLDIDRFKNVNDTFGHQAGDALIFEFGARLVELLRSGDTIARLGGDEFAVVIENTGPVEMQGLCARIQETVAQPFALLGNEAYVGVSAGVAIAALGECDSTELTRRADIALYRAKAEGRGTCRQFTTGMDETVQLRGAIETQLRHALASGEGLFLQYQPLVSGSSGEIVGLEALVRWDHPERGVVPTELFVSVAEETGLIVPLGDMVLAEACRVAARWPQLYIAVNLSPVQFRDPSLAERICTIVAERGVDPHRIQLELTERVLLVDSESLRATLGQLRAAGFSIALDDFGTGYSSLSYLRKYRVDKIKIDRSFVHHLGQADDASSIVLAVLALGEALGLVVTAEGVETEDQRRFLSTAGCREMQGFYFSEPVASDELDRLPGLAGQVRNRRGHAA